MNTADLLKPVTLITLVIGLIAGSAITRMVKNTDDSNGNAESNAPQPLYWVAPMDSNFQRDSPGKSPMGMDLVPVYETEKATNDAGPGTIRIAPHIVNNLGVRTALAKTNTLNEKIVTVGYVKFDEDKLIHIHPRVSGWVDKLYVKSTGDPVSAGEPLYSLYSPELVNAQEEFILALNRNNDRLIKASQDRLSALQIPPSFVEKLKRKKSVEQSITFYAPQDGVIDNLNIREGFYVQPGTTLFSIGALDKVWVEAEIFERQAAFVAQGQAVTMTLDYLPGKTWQGQVDYIYPTLNSQTRTMTARLKFNNPERRLLPNMFAQVVIHSESQQTHLLIPQEALIRTGTQNRVVLALGEGSFKSIEVKTGREDQDYVAILDGLHEGEKVVTSAQFLLDSESSKTSDFIRMSPPQESQSVAPESVWVAAEIQEQHVDLRQVSASHDAIDQWNMAGMTMRFTVDDKVDFNALTPGTELHMEIKKGASGMFTIIGIHIMSAHVSPAHDDKNDAHLPNVDGKE